jgi:hypothetical protein
VKHIYYVAFAHARGFGSCEWAGPEVFTSNDQVREVAAGILEATNCGTVTILSWQFLRVEPTQEG